MTDLNNATVIKCPWCHNRLNIIRSGKSGQHYANCGSWYQFNNRDYDRQY